jgi:GcrA cell cycle regulator
VRIWNDETIPRLKELWNEGLSCSQVAAVLREEFKVTISRNAVIGKIHRLGIQARSRNPKVVIRPRPVVASKPKPSAPKAPRRRAPVPVPIEQFFAPAREGGVSLLELEYHHCRWIEGNPSDERPYCGASRIVGRSYCPHHNELSIGKGTPRERNSIKAAMRVA